MTDQSRSKVTDRPIYSPISPQWALWGMLGAIVGAAFISFLTTGGVKANGISYSDLAAVMLAAVTLVLTVLGLAIAVAAIYGYRAFMDTSSETATRVAREEAILIATDVVKDYIANSAEQLLIAQAEAVALRVISPQRLQQLIREQVDAVLLGSQADDELDEDEEIVNQAMQAQNEPGNSDDR
jgi:hypothetical protein